MPSMSEIREKYPQYKDMSDADLADGLYRKFYSDMPRAEFDAKVGVARPSGSFLGRGVAEGLGALPDLASAGMQAIGLTGPGSIAERASDALGIPRMPFQGALGGSQSIEAGMSAAGIPVPPPGAEPQTLGERVARGVGTAAGAMLPVGGVATAVGRGTGMAGDIARNMMQATARNPATALALETGAGAMSGVGGHVAAGAYPGNKSAEAIGEIMGGLSPLALAAAPRAIASAAEALPVAGTAIRAGRRMLPGAGRVRAEDRVQGLAGDPAASAAALDEPSIADLTPAQRTGDKRLMALERSVLDADASLDASFAERTSANMQTLRQAMDAGGSPDSASQFVEGRRARLTELLDRRTSQASELAQQRIAQLDPSMRPAQASTIVREEVENALRASRAQEGQLWADVPMDTPVSTQNASKAMDDLLAVTPRAQREDIPAIAQRFLLRESNNFLGAESTVNEVWGLRSKLLEASRTARAAGEYNTARISDNLADALLEDLGAQTGRTAGEGAEKLRLALDFSRDLSERFKRGTVGRLLRREATGAERVAPELTLDSAIGTGGIKGALGADDILRAAPGANRGIEQFVLSRLQQSVVRNGEFDAARARSFVGENEELLQRVPGLRQRVLDAAAAQDDLTRVRSRGERVHAALRDKGKSQAARFLDGDPEQAFDRVLKAKNSTLAARELRRQVQKDATGNAVLGLKATVSDYLIRRAGTNQFDDFGVETLSGRALTATLRDPKIRNTAREILSPEEMRRLEIVAKELTAIETSAGRLPAVGGVINDMPSTILSLVARTMAARTGAKLGQGTSGASLLTAGFFSKRASQMLQRLTNDTAREILVEAVQSPPLMRALLTNTTTVSGRRVAAQRLNAWLSGPGRRLAESFADENEE